MTEDAKHIYTAANITDEDRSLYSDLFKEIYDVRPYGIHSDHDIALFLNNYDVMIAQRIEEDEQQLARLSDRLGENFKTWSDYYNYLDREEQKDWAERKARFEAEQQEREENRAFLKAFFAPFSIIAAITLWEEGAI